MASGIARYQMVNVAGAPREAEAVAFSTTNLYLSKAADPTSRRDALYRNHQLWSLLLKDLGMRDNRLPAELKRMVSDLAIWSMNYSRQALAQPLSLEPLIVVNRNIIEGLRAAPAPPAATGSLRAALAV